VSNALRFYQDSGMTLPAGILLATQADSGAAGPVDRVVWLGSPIPGSKFQAESNPGVAQISIAAIDSLAGLQLPASTVRLSLTNDGLGAAIPGAALDLGTQVFSGVGNALAVYIRIDAPAVAVGDYGNLALETVSTIEVAA
jgi:hypothetical protein